MTRPDSFTIELPPTETSDGYMLAWMGVDAVRWARACERVIANTPGDLDLIGWFASAIGAGESYGTSGLAAARSDVAELRKALDAAQDEIEARILASERDRELIRQLGVVVDHMAPAAYKAIMAAGGVV